MGWQSSLARRVPHGVPLARALHGVLYHGRRAHCTEMPVYAPHHLYEIFQEVVDSGSQFPYECSSIQEFHRQFFGPNSQVYVVCSSKGEILGCFYIKPNYSGRSAHIANAAYMIGSAHRGQGIGTLLVKASLEVAKDLGFQAMQFNMVLSQNLVALKLYQKLGFNIIGTIPRAIRNPDGSYQQGHVLHRELNI